MRKHIIYLVCKRVQSRPQIPALEPATFDPVNVCDSFMQERKIIRQYLDMLRG
jgi:hypothetical protein